MDKQKVVRTTIDLPVELNDKLCAEAVKEKRSRHLQMIVSLEKFFENGKSQTKPHLIMPKVKKVKIK